MKTLYTTLFLTAAGFCAHAQNNVGINNPLPDASAALDITSTTQGILVPRMDSSQRVGISSPARGLLVYQTNGVVSGFYYYNGTAWTSIVGSANTSQLEKITEGGNTGYRLLGANAANFGNIGSGATDLSTGPQASSTAGATGQNAFAAGIGTQASGQSSTAFGSGSLATGSYSAAFGGSAQASGSFSFATGFSSIASGGGSVAMGMTAQASGGYAVALGNDTRASGYTSFAVGNSTLAPSMGEVAVGNYNTSYTPSGTNTFNSADRAFTVGTGNSSARKDGLIVYKDGTLTMENLSAAPTTATRRLYTQSDSLYFSGTNLMRANTSQLEKLTENGQTGYRLYGAKATNYGDIGSGAVDLSVSTLNGSSLNGATGTYAFAANQNNIASGTTSAAFGNNTTASGDYAVASGYFSTASGAYSKASGNSATASGASAAAIGNVAKAFSLGEVAVGNYNTTYTPVGTTTFNSADRAFVVGTGISGATNDGLIVYKDGTVELDSLGTAPTTTNNRMYARQDSLYFQGTNLMRSTSTTSQLEKLTENSNTGYRLYGASAANYGDIGAGAVDLSSSTGASTTRGATGTNAFATGSGTTASGSNSTAIGQVANASGSYSTAMGTFTTASGSASTAMGSSTTASNSNSTTMGSSTTASGIASTAMGSSATASGTASTAMGTATVASGLSSTAMGAFTTASADASTAMGQGTTAYSYGETAIGLYSTIYTPASTSALSKADRAFTVGIGSSSVRNDGLIVYKNGTVELDSLGSTPSTINNRIYTQQDSLWFQGTNLMRSTSTPSQLEQITEGSNTGYRLCGASAANYGDIGAGAIDLSSSASTSTTRGATGSNAFATGQANTASGNGSTVMGASNIASGGYSTAMGAFTTASGNYSTAMGISATASGDGSIAMGSAIASGNASTAMGINTTASAEVSTAMGSNTTAPSYGETAIGTYNTIYTPANTGDFNAADRAFTVGIGTISTRNDGLIVYKNGTVELDSLGGTPSTTNNRIYTQQDSLWFQSTNLMRSTSTPSQLEKITEGGNTGYRLYGASAANYGNIGSNATDLSSSASASNTRGATGINAFATGINTTASNDNAIALGNNNTASGLNSTALGANTLASNNGAFAVGINDTASGFASVAMGDDATASGQKAVAIGWNTQATAFAATAMGANSVASASGAMALGVSTTASGNNATAMGDGTIAPSAGEAAVGMFNTTYTPVSTNALNTADRAFTVGIGTSSARKDGLIVYKDGTLALNNLSAAPAITANRLYTQSSNLYFNGKNLSSQLEKITENGKTGYRLLGMNPANYGDIGTNAVDLSTNDYASTIEGATGDYSTAMGYSTNASGSASTAMGFYTNASGPASTAIGNNTTASGNYSTAMGNGTTASGPYSTAMGQNTSSSGFNTFAAGKNTTASGSGSVAMGQNTTASATSAVAMGSFATASGEGAIALGFATNAPSLGETAVGVYNTTYTPSGVVSIVNTDRAFVVGIGSSSARADGFTVFKSGRSVINSTVASTNGSIIAGYYAAGLQVQSAGDALSIVSPEANNSVNIYKATTPSSSSAAYLSFGYTNGGNTEIGSVKSNSSGTGVVYNTSSDARLKINNGAYRLGLKTINDIHIHNYTWKSNGAKEVGVFAQELYKVYPNAVSKGDDNDSAISQRWMVDYSKLVPVLTAAVQELSAENDKLKAELAAAKAVQTRTEASLEKLNSRLEALEAMPVTPTALHK